MIETDIIADMGLALPEIVLAVGAMALLMFGVFRGDRSSATVSGLSVALMAIAALIVLTLPDERTLAFSGGFVVDAFAKFMKVLVLVASAVALIIAQNYLRSERMMRFELPVLVVLATLGMLMMISANDLITLYVGIEMQSLSLYVLAAFNRDSLRSTEAGLKYFVLGALSSGLLLYGASLVYGFTGATNFENIGAVLAMGDTHIGFVIGLVFMLAGLAFKISAVPFHMWTPDVYEGAPTPITAFFAAAPKIAAIAIFARVLNGPFPELADEWRQIIIFVSVASMLLGAFAAIGQANIKRLMAYSTIGHMGYVLVGLAAGTAAGVKGVLIYMAVYFVTTLGVFVCILSMRRKDGMVERIEDLAGLSRNQPMMAFALAMLLVSLSGIPPLAGFFAKLMVFIPAVQAGLWPLVLIGVVASVVSAFYYWRIIKVMYFDNPAEKFVTPLPIEMRTVLTVSTGLVIIFAGLALPIFAAAEYAAQSLF
jgi:NADH-quinone oxidoreductase subunit N